MALLRPILFFIVLGCWTAYSDESLIFLTKEEAKKQKEEIRQLQLDLRAMTQRAETSDQQLEALKKQNEELLTAVEAVIETYQTLLEQPRRWTTMTGDGFFAKLGSITEEKVVLESAKGEKRPFPRSKLSNKDRSLLDLVEQARAIEENVRVAPTIDPDVPQAMHAVDIIKVPVKE